MAERVARGVSLRPVDPELPLGLTSSVTSAPTQEDEPAKPPLKWAGGKRWLVPHLLPVWKAHGRRRLVEPFAGGLAVTLSLIPERALLNDANPHLINFYSWLKRVLSISIPLANEEDAFYAHRERFNELLRAGQQESAEAASLFYYLNRTGF